MSSFYCVDTASCQSDAAITILGKMYGNGFIQGFLTEGVVASQVRPGSSDLAPVLLGGLADVSVILAMVMFFCLLFTSLITSAQDGEAFGKGSSKVIIVIRFLASMAMLLPTASGYCMIQVVLMFLVLWSNGETNKLYNNVVKSGIVSTNVSFASKSTEADIYGLRGLAMAHFKQLVCVNTLNAVYYGQTVPPTGGTHNLNSGSGTIMTDTSDIYLPSNGVGMVGAVDISAQNATANSTVFSIALQDNGKKITTRSDEAICGSVTYTVKDPEQAAKEIFENSKNTNAQGRKILGYSEEDQVAVILALASVHDAIQTSKLDHIDATFYEVTNWVGTNIPSWDPTSPTLKADFESVKWSDLEIRIEEKVKNSRRAYLDILTRNGSEVTDAMNVIVKSLTHKGWTYAAGIRQRIIAIQSDIQKIVDEPAVSLISPSNNLRINDDRAAAVSAFMRVLQERFSDQYNANPLVSAEPTPSQIKETVPSSFDEDTALSKFVKNIESGLVNMVGNFQRDLVYTLMRGEATSRNGLVSSGNSANPVVGLDDNVDVLSNIQRSGELLLLFQNRLILTEVGVRSAMLTATATTALLPFGSERGKTLAEAAYYWIEKIIMYPISLLLKASFILGTYMAVIIPSMPYFFFMTAVVAWYVHILQAMAGLPFWAVMHMVPERSFVGSQTQGYVTLVCLFMRPLLTLVGLFFAFIMANPILYFITDSFFAMQGTMVASTSGSTFMLIVTELLTFQIWLVVYCTLVLQVCYMIFGLAGSLPDSVLKWIGSGLNSGEWGHSDAKTSLGAGAANAQSFGGGGAEKSGGNQPTNGPKKDGAASNGGGDNGGGAGGGATGGGATGGGGNTAASTPANNVRSGADDAQAQSAATKADQSHSSDKDGAGSIASNDGGKTPEVGGGDSPSSTPGSSTTNASTIGSDTAGNKQAALDEFKSQGGLVGSDGKPLDNLGLINARAHDGAPKGVQTAMAAGAIGGLAKSIASGNFKNLGQSMSQGANTAGHAHFAQHGGAKIQDNLGNHIANSGKGNVQGVVSSLRNYNK